MTRTSLQVLLIYTSLSVISAMPYLDSEDVLDKYDDTGDYTLEQNNAPNTDDDAALGDIGLDILSNKIYKILSQFKSSQSEELPEDREHNIVGLYNSPTKRFGFRFTPFARHFRSEGTRGLFPSRVFVASRGKRQEIDMLPFHSGGYDNEIQEVQRRRGFTALRGR